MGFYREFELKIKYHTNPYVLPLRKHVSLGCCGTMCIGNVAHVEVE